MNNEAAFKFILSFILAIAGASAAAYCIDSVVFSLLVGWDLFGLTYLAFSMYTFLHVPQERILERASKEDFSRWLLFLVIVIAGVAGLVTVLSFFGSREVLPTPHWLNSVVGIGAIVVSWMMVHTAFSFRYAHLYYGDDNKQFSQHARGLVFPEDDAPDYFDFAYFSFVIGMTFQVSDVVITGKGVRRLVLMHSIMAFVFNTVVIALTVSELINRN
jgi:uncharacterized membrane protein